MPIEYVKCRQRPFRLNFARDALTLTHTETARDRMSRKSPHLLSRAMPLQASQLPRHTASPGAVRSRPNQIPIVRQLRLAAVQFFRLQVRMQSFTEPPRVTPSLMSGGLGFTAIHGSRDTESAHSVISTKSMQRDKSTAPRRHGSSSAQQPRFATRFAENNFH
jgi:hypothetical protein